MKFRVHGADSKTARDVELEVKAEDKQKAEAIAVGMGIYVSASVPVKASVRPRAGTPLRNWRIVLSGCAAVLLVSLLIWWINTKDSGKRTPDNNGSQRALRTAKAANLLREATKMLANAHSGQQAASATLGEDAILTAIASEQAQIGDVEGISATMSRLQSHPGSRVYLNEALVLAAAARAEAGDPDGAQRFANSLDETAGVRAHAFAAIGRVLVKQGRDDLARNCFARAREIAVKSKQFSDTSQGLAYLVTEQAAAGMISEAQESALVLKKLADNAAVGDAQIARSASGEAYAAIAIALNRSGQYQHAERLLDSTLFRDGVIHNLVNDRAKALNMANVSDQIVAMTDHFARCRALFSVARILSELGPSFTKQRDALAAIAIKGMDSYDRSDSRFHTLAGDMAMIGGDRQTGEKMLELIASLPPQYQVPAQIVVASASLMEGNQEVAHTRFREAIAAAITISPQESTARNLLLREAFERWAFELGDETATEHARSLGSPALRAISLVGVARSQIACENLLALGTSASDEAGNPLWNKLTADWRSSSNVASDRVLFINKSTGARGFRQAVFFRVPRGVGVAFPARLAGLNTYSELNAATLAWGKEETTAVGEIIDAPIGAERAGGSLVARKQVMDRAPHWIIITLTLRNDPPRGTTVVEPPVRSTESAAGNQITLDCGGGTSMKFVRIEPGTFMMGSPPSEEDRKDDETQHKVIITKVFYMGTTEVTQEQYQAVMGRNPSDFKGERNLPVEMVSWDDAVSFCQKLSQRTGKKLRLPTEAEWEYACRAGSNRAFAGNGRLRDMGWYDGNSGKKTHVVGTMQANAWGLYDMHGNVWEWCSDWYGEYPTGEAADPSGPSTGKHRVLRGGSWDDFSRICRAAFRFSDSPDRRYCYILGFRLAMDLH